MSELDYHFSPSFNRAVYGLLGEFASICDLEEHEIVPAFIEHITYLATEQERHRLENLKETA